MLFNLGLLRQHAAVVCMLEVVGDFIGHATPLRCLGCPSLTSAHCALYEAHARSAPSLGSRLIKSTIRGRPLGRRNRDNCVPVCHSGWRCA
jgi:hypothetical protein